jgi:taurine dioxygenase
MKVIPTASVLGAEIAGVDLSRRLDDATFVAIEHAYNEHGVIFFRGQSITPAQQVTFTRRFGEIEFNIFGERWSVPGQPEIVVLSNITEGGQPTGVRRAGENSHSDMCYTARPPRGTILYAIEIPELHGLPLGDTEFRQCRCGLGCFAGCDEAHPRGAAGRVRHPSHESGIATRHPGRTP